MRMEYMKNLQPCSTMTGLRRAREPGRCCPRAPASCWRGSISARLTTRRSSVRSERGRCHRHGAGERLATTKEIAQPRLPPEYEDQLSRRRLGDALDREKRGKREAGRGRSPVAGSVPLELEAVRRRTDDPVKEIIAVDLVHTW